jgi:hypothetical protein
MEYQSESQFPRAIATTAAPNHNNKCLGLPREWPAQGQPKTNRKQNNQMKTKLALIITLAGCFLCGNIFAAPPLPGAIFTTDSTCSGVDLNIYGAKSEVYLNGGPSHPGAASLPDGSYYVQVTDPSGACVLGTSGNNTPFVVTNGVANCIQLCTVLTNGDGACALNGVDPSCGYNTTTNPGGEYKAWVSNEPSFTNSSTKTDNFKVREDPPPNPPTLCVNKFYDANVNGIKDAGECYINGWPIQVFADDNLYIARETAFCSVVDQGSYRVVEADIANWLHTGAVLNGQPFTAVGSPSTVYPVTLAPDQTVEFGNVCLGAGGGLTLGFWSNKNGQRIETQADLTFLSGLCLVDATGLHQTFGSQAFLSSWLLNANAVNMAYMLSAQLAAMELNVRHPGVTGSALVYGGDCVKAYQQSGQLPGSNGFITINALMTAANNALCADGYTPSGDPNRAYQECLKTSLDNGNNNLNFVQSQPCSPFTCAQ